MERRFKHGYRLVDGRRWADIVEATAAPPEGDDITLALLLEEVGLGAESDGLATPELARIAWDRFNHLKGLMAQWTREYRELELHEATGRMATELIPLVVQWTKAEGPWYHGVRVALAWALESRGVDVDEARFFVAEATTGRFHSWAAPSARTVGRVGVDLAAVVSKAGTAPSPGEDALTTWRQLRTDLKEAPRRRPGDQPTWVLDQPDGHRRFIDEVDRGISRARASRMRAALSLARGHALRGRPLSVDQLAMWQHTVLDRTPVIRSSDAFAKGGRERYGTPPDLAGVLNACLAETSDRELPIAVRATKAYLDICYFHPFEDGNGRLARLVMDFILTREGFALAEAGPIFRVARWVRDVAGAEGLVRLVSALSGTPPIALESVL